MQGCFLVSANWWHNVHALGGGSKGESLLVEVFICLNLDFLTETNNWISTENVSFFIAHNLENVSCNGALACFASVEAVGLLDVDLADTKISSQVSINLLVANENGVTWFEEAISRVGPWHNFVTMLHLTKSVIEGESFSSASHLIVVGSIHEFKGCLMITWWCWVRSPRTSYRCGSCGNSWGLLEAVELCTAYFVFYII